MQKSEVLRFLLRSYAVGSKRVKLTTVTSLPSLLVVALMEVESLITLNRLNIRALMRTRNVGIKVHVTARTKHKVIS